MRILNLGAPFLVSALQRLGHEVCSVGLHPGCAIRLEHPLAWTRLRGLLRERGFDPECALWCDDGNLPFLLGLEHMPFPAIFYSIDTYCNPWHPPFAYAFDAALVAQQGHVALFPDLAERAAWMPLFAPDGLLADPGWT